MPTPTNLADYNKASLRDLEGIIQKRPDDAFAHLVLGFKLADSRQFDRAEQSFRRVLELDPDHAEATHYLGRTQLDRNRPQEALDTLDAAASQMEAYCSRTGRGVTICRADNNLFRARALAQLGRRDEALEAISTCLQDNPLEFRARHLETQLR